MCVSTYCRSARMSAPAAMRGHSSRRCFLSFMLYRKCAWPLYTGLELYVADNTIQNAEIVCPLSILRLSRISTIGFIYTCVQLEASGPESLPSGCQPQRRHSLQSFLPVFSQHTGLTMGTTLMHHVREVCERKCWSAEASGCKQL